jgi:predicted site-specific integrase-resolvase
MADVYARVSTRVQPAAMNQEELEEQIDRCRRIASIMTDDDVRHSLEQLANEYEALLTPSRRSFMLSGRPQNN